ncbi:MAG: hypothetical protein ACPKNR_09320 [Pleomorphochaeta sp.]
MNKKLLSTLLVLSFVVMSLFAYSAPNVILKSTLEETDYSFKLQKLNSAMTGFEDFDGDYTENIVLNSEVGVTNAFTVSTVANGNMKNDITFIASVTTGEFKDLTDSSFDTGVYPRIVELSESATTENYTRGDEEVTYELKTAGDFVAPSSGVFTTIFTRGIHLYGTEIARFKLEYKDVNKNIAAGTYTSVTKIDISTN